MEVVLNVPLSIMAFNAVVPMASSEIPFHNVPLPRKNVTVIASATNLASFVPNVVVSIPIVPAVKNVTKASVVPNVHKVPVLQVNSVKMAPACPVVRQTTIAPLTDLALTDNVLIRVQTIVPVVKTPFVRLQIIVLFVYVPMDSAENLHVNVSPLSVKQMTTVTLVQFVTMVNVRIRAWKQVLAEIMHNVRL